MMAVEYKVHVFAIVRVPVTVEAASQVNAIEKAIDSVDWYAQFGGGREDQEFAEEFKYFLVDEVGDEGYRRSLWYDCNDKNDIALMDGATKEEE